MPWGMRLPSTWSKVFEVQNNKLMKSEEESGLIFGLVKLFNYFFMIIGDFVTKVEREPLPGNPADAGFDVFEEHALKLRLRVWTAVAHLVVVFGEAVKPYHLPPEILKAVSDAYQKRASA
jgi:hypothetical protein